MHAIYLNLSFTYPVILEKIFQITQPYFCDYLPFEEVVALLKTLESPSCKGDLYQVLIEIGLMVLKKIFKDFFLYKHI
jgi:hypothetical protein